MTAQVDELLTDLNSRGIRLETDGDRLRFHPKSLVTADLLARMRACKGELLAALAERNNTGVFDGRTREREVHDDATRACSEPDGRRPDHAVPDGWTRERWAARLAYLADICIVPERAAELRQWRAKVLSEGLETRV